MISFLAAAAAIDSCEKLQRTFQTVGCCGPAAEEACSGPIDVVLNEARAAEAVPIADFPYPVGAHYDDSSVVSGNETFCPFSFGSTFAHPPPLYAPRCADVQALQQFSRCPSAAFDLRAGSHRLLAAGDARLALPGRVRTPPPDAFVAATSAQQAYEMLEVYAMAYLRDCPIDAFSTACASRCAVVEAALGSFGAAVACDSLARVATAQFAHAASEPTLSQFWFQSVGISPVATLSDRTFRHEEDARVLWTRAGFRANEEGGEDPSVARRATPQFVHSGRSLGSLVHGDEPHTHYAHAATALAAVGGVYAQAFGVPGVASSLLRGKDDVVTSVAEVARVALAESYRAKYLASLKVRPASFAALVDLRGQSGLGAVEAVHAHLFDGAAREALLDAVAAWSVTERGGGVEQNYLLPTLFATTRHPSWTHGHATVAGACVTLLKAFHTLVRDDGFFVEWSGDVLKPSADGAATMTAPVRTSYVAELDKLAFNVGLGRNFAGQHFRTELEASLAFGESIGVNFVRARLCGEEAYAADASVVVPLFNGTCVRVSRPGCALTTVSPCGGLAPAPPPPPVVQPPPPPAPPLSPILQSYTSVPVSVDAFRRLVPQPTLSMTPATPVLADAIRVRQRQMSFGDSTTKLAKITINGGATYPVAFGLPSLDGSTGTLLVNFTDDAFGRVGHAEYVDVPLGDAVNVTQFSYVVERVYPFVPDTPPPRNYGGRANIVIDGTKYGFALMAEPTSAASAVTDTFYGNGTWDVGLVDVEFLLAGQLVPAYGLSASDNGGLTNVASEDAASNAFLNPYRDADCDRTVNAYDQMSNTHCREADERYYIKYDGEYRKWPCDPADTAELDCSLFPVSKAWSWPGWAVRSNGNVLNFKLKPLATPDTFSLLYPKPKVTFTWPAALGASTLGLRQRHMAMGDATIKTARVCFNDDATCSTVSFSFADGTALFTNFTWPAPDPYGRAGLAAERTLSVPVAGVTSVSVEVIEIHGYTPDAEWLTNVDAEKAKWGVTKMEEEQPTYFGYVHATMGTWNVGLTHMALYDGAGVLLPEADVVAGAASANGAFAYTVGDVDIFSPRNPLVNPYKSDTTFIPSVHTSWCWWGHSVVNGDLASYGFLSTPPTYDSSAAPPPPPMPLEPEAIGEPTG